MYHYHMKIYNKMYRISSVNIFTKNELISFAIDNPSDDIYYWIDTMRQSAENSQNNQQKKI